MAGDPWRRHRGVALALLAAVSACAPLAPRPPQAPGDGAATGRPPAVAAIDWATVTPRIDVVAGAAAYAGARTYAGVLSCAGCTAQRLTLTILADGTFRLRQADAIEGAAPARYDFGRWAASPESADMIALHGDTPGARLFRRVLPDGLAVVDNEGREIRGLDRATLARAPSVDPLPGPLRLVGSYRLEGTQPVFVECLTGRRLPVTDGTPASGAPQAARMLADAQSALDSAHRAVSAAPGEPVLVIVQGYLVPRVAQPGNSEREALVVAVFERAMRDARCEDIVRRTP